LRPGIGNGGGAAEVNPARGWPKKGSGADRADNSPGNVAGAEDHGAFKQEFWARIKGASAFWPIFLESQKGRARLYAAPSNITVMARSANPT